jgi:hypothetical protein
MTEQLDLDTLRALVLDEEGHVCRVGGRGENQGGESGNAKQRPHNHLPNHSGKIRMAALN